VEPGKLLMLCRTAVNVIYKVISTDRGKTW
jgi:hypothetical protein